jgi:methyl-accepting chemotaxis protein
MEDATGRIDAASRQADASGGVLEAIVSYVDRTTDQVRSIATASEEQSASSEAINRSLTDITRIAAETSDTMERAAKGVEALVRQAQALDALIARMQQAREASGAAP